MSCRHFFVTWLEGYPRGCRAYGFRGPDLPSVVVLRESGLPCQYFEARPRKPEDGDEREGRLVH